MQRHIDTLTKTIHNYLERKSSNCENPPWEIRKSALGGFGLFATRAIEPGELIFKDHPVILGPRSAITGPLVCVSCFKKDNLKLCERECGLPLCSLSCQNSFSHQKECKIIRQWLTHKINEELSDKLFKVLTPIRFLLLSGEDKAVVKCLKAHISPQHGLEVDLMKNNLHLNMKEDEEIFMRFACSVMDSNAFEVIVRREENQISIKGLYSVGSLANHSCTPNAYHVFDDSQYMIVRASNFIPKGAEIFYSYSRAIWGTPSRRLYLYKTKQFLCKCERCQDPTEFNTYISAILCKICKTGCVVPIDPLINNAKWQCESCGEIINSKDVAALSSLLGAALNSFNNEDLDCMLRFIQEKLCTLVPENNEVVVGLKYRIILILGYQPGYTWAELPDSLLYIKEKFCRDLLTLLDNLNLGQCKLRGSLLYELYSCYKEATRRGKQNREQNDVSKTKVHENDIKGLILEAADILMYDADTPNEVKEQWREELKNLK